MEIKDLVSKNGQVNSKRLSEYIGCSHKDLMKRIQRKYKYYIGYQTEVNKYSHTGKIKVYKLESRHINLIKFNGKEELLDEISRVKKNLDNEIRKSLSILFGE
ncbi:MAG: hypothetical protein ACRCX2_14925 [Paraclostridium sp.]